MAIVPSSAMFHRRSSRNLLVFLMSLTLATSTNTTDLLKNQCDQQCTDDLASNSIDRDLECDLNCKLEQCEHGCTLWSNTTLSSCQNSCNQTSGTETEGLTKVQYCYAGCIYAHDIFAEIIKGEIGLPTPPMENSTTVTHNSVLLFWEQASLSQVTYIIEWRYEDVANQWKIYNSQPVSGDSLLVEGLYPYKSYEFRVVWVITELEFLYSVVSHVVITDAYGVPSSAPIISQLVSPSPSTIYAAWAPPEFPNGELLKYTITLSTSGIPDSEDFHINLLMSDYYYEFTVGLESDTAYNFSILAENGEGQGPPAIQSVTTLSIPVDNETAMAFVGLGDSVSSLVLDDQFYEQGNPEATSRFAPPTPATVTDVAVDYWNQVLFVSTNESQVFRVFLNLTAENTTVYNSNLTQEVIYHGSGNVTALSYDWLFHQLYFLDGSQVMRCNFDGSQPETVLDDLTDTPRDVKVDPFNGYLFWTRAGGLFRLDLANIESPDISQPEAEQIVSRPDLNVLTLDPASSTVFFTNGSSLDGDAAGDTNDHIARCLVDGSNVGVASQKTNNQLYLGGTTDLIRYDGLFSYINGEEQLITEICFDICFRTHVTGPQSEGLRGMDLFHHLAQPLPSPSFAPGSLQALFTASSALVSWEKPQRSGLHSQGAWEDWEYEIEVTSYAAENGSSATLAVRTVRTLETSYWLTDLAGASLHSVRVRASHPAAQAIPGPFSSPFVGATLEDDEDDAFLIAYTNNEVQFLSFDGTEINSLNSDITNMEDLDWFDQYLVWSTAEGGVSYTSLYNSSDIFTVDVASSAGPVAVDWLGGVLYWADKTSIRRTGLLDGGGALLEEVVVSSAVRDLAVDSLEGQLYWTTATVLESARLNGNSRFQYAAEPDFSGRQMAGLTLDLDSEKVYWFVSVLGGDLEYWEAALATAHSNPSQTAKLVATIAEAETLQNTLHYFSGKLFFVSDSSRITVKSIISQDLAALDRQQAVQTFSVHHPSLHPLPAGFTDKPTVVPSQILADSITIANESHWSDFNITWPASDVNYGTVFYILKVNDLTVEVTEPYYPIRDMEPYQLLQITLLTYTYWGTTPATSTQFYSPMAVPGPPTDPQVYVTHRRDIYSSLSTAVAEFRWSPPAQPNGVVAGYQLEIGILLDNQTLNLTLEPMVDGSTLSFVYDDHLDPPTTYYFRVSAITAEGMGNSTDIIEFKPESQKPVPRLLQATSLDGLQLLDLDNQQSASVSPASQAAVLALTYLTYRDRVFWIEPTGNSGGNALFSGSASGENVEQLLELEGSPRGGLAADWIGLRLYWTQDTDIIGYDLTSGQMAQPVTGLTGDHPTDVKVDPYNSYLFWVDPSGVLMRSTVDGEGQTPLLDPSSRRRRRDTATENCTCVQQVVVAASLALDHSDPDHPQLYFFVQVDASITGIWRSDVQGCTCSTVLSRNFVEPGSMTVDDQYLYWTDDGMLNRVDKTFGTGLDSQDASGINLILAYGKNLQPLPESSCIQIGDYAGVASLTEATDSSLSLGLGVPAFPEVCGGLSMPTTNFMVSYGSEHCDNVTTCSNTQVTFDPAVDLSELEAFTNYTVWVTATNFYSPQAQTGPPTVHRTLQGVPSAVQNVEVVVETNLQLLVCWDLPANPRGHPANIRYEVGYRLAVTTQPWDLTTPDQVTPPGDPDYWACSDRYKVRIAQLETATTYQFQVRAWPVDMPDISHSSLSDPVTATTYQAPADPVVISATNTTFNISWTSPSDHALLRRLLLYTESPQEVPGSWRNACLVAMMDMCLPDDSPDQTSTTYYATIGDDTAAEPIKPNTKYYFRANVMYKSNLPFEYPSDYQYSTGMTLAGVPGEIATINVIDDPSLGWKVDWSEPESNGEAIEEYVLEYSGGEDGNWTEAYRGPETSWLVADLEYNYTYVFRVAAINGIGQGQFSQDSSPFNLAANVPDPPGKPYFVNSIDGWIILWAASKDDGGSPVQFYLLETMMLPNGSWLEVYRGDESDGWPLDSLQEDKSYLFRVAAKNLIGWSQYSPDSDPFSLSAPDSQSSLIIISASAAAGAVFIILIILIILFILTQRRQKRRRGKKGAEGAVVHFSPDQELATLRAYPNIVFDSNSGNNGVAVGTLQDGTAIDLPLFPRNKLKLITFLGSGAFGEVFEGVADDILAEDSGPSKVAVKTLRKGATDQEKEEFLKEAQLMSNFRHSNILSLLGVCLDNDPQYIILELMEGGDLLSFLRGCRPSHSAPALLNLADMVDIGIDVAKGCGYLEQLHFVHRDLAARNCLVSSKNPKSRTVKIGDFGLARDIYKNDYYRKEGEGLLPVRWMSPESLVDSIFTTQSDIWSYGVLLWEILTLGQQPYPARTNLEVLHFVTSGGRLDRPDNSPDDLHNIISKCWKDIAEHRPAFTHILEELQTYRKSIPNDELGGSGVSLGLPRLNYLRVKQTTGDSTTSEDGYLLPMDSSGSVVPPPPTSSQQMLLPSAAAPTKGQRSPGRGSREAAGPSAAPQHSPVPLRKPPSVPATQTPPPADKPYHDNRAFQRDSTVPGASASPVKGHGGKGQAPSPPRAEPQVPNPFRKDSFDEISDGPYRNVSRSGSPIAQQPKYSNVRAAAVGAGGGRKVSSTNEGFSDDSMTSTSK